MGFRNLQLNDEDVMLRLVDKQSVNDFFHVPDIGSLRLFLKKGFNMSFQFVSC